MGPVEGSPHGIPKFDVGLSMSGLLFFSKKMPLPALRLPWLSDFNAPKAQACQ